jgi:polysaccharide chain length determinant protein (PEP-CTERM system associated)
MIGQREMTIDDYLSILRRRIWLLVIPAVVCAAGAYTVSLFLPSKWTSETVVLVEEPAVPDSIVKPIISGDLNQRLATMREQILSRTRLQQMIEKFGLFREDEGKRSTEELVARLRNSIEVSPVRPMAETRYNGLPGFTVSVVASQAQLAQQICTEITSIFMQQNILFRARRTDDTNDFISKQLQEAKAKLDEQDAKLADFQRRYMGELPDEMQTNFSLLTGLSSQLESVNQALNRAQQDKIFVESMLSQQIVASKLSVTGENPDRLTQELNSLQNQLSTMQGRYTDEYPDIVKLKNAIAQVQKKIQAQQSATAYAAGSSKPDQVGLSGETPQVQQLRSQLHQIDVTIRERTAEQGRIQQSVTRVQAKLQLSPAIAQQYKALTRDYQTALNFYNDFLKKQTDAGVSTELERRQQGEQFRVLDPPSLPQKPTFPNRPVFGLGGLMAGLGIGLSVALLLEARDTSLRTDRDVELLLKLPVLALIPVVQAVRGIRDSDGIGNGNIKPPAETAKLRIGV